VLKVKGVKNIYEQRFKKYFLPNGLNISLEGKNKYPKNANQQT